IVGLSGLFYLGGTGPVQADHRPFPKYELTYEKLTGHPTPNGEPGPWGDGCIRDLEAPVVPLTFFGVSAMLDQCEGVRTTVRFFLEEDSPGSPTLEFRWGVTWQYQTQEQIGSNDLTLKPVENFTYDGESVSTEQYDPENPAVVDDEGNLVRMSDGDGWYRPIHYVFEDTFGAGEEHILQFDAYVPLGAERAGMTWGTGSTGDTSGGSIGATANKLKVFPPARMDFRYVLHSEYLAARGFAQDEELTKDYDVPGLPERKWATADSGIEGTAFELIDCLEANHQHLADVSSSAPVNEIYPELPFDTLTHFEDRVGDFGFALWPWEFYTYQSGLWDPKSGLRLMNRNHDTGEIDPYLKDDGSYMALPYKPTVESLIRDIPGYRYVDNDITMFEKGKFDLESPPKTYNYLTAPNVQLRKVGDERTQHFYYTYEPIPGTFELEKSAVNYVAEDEGFTAMPVPLEGAEFELYEVVDPTTTACGLEPNLDNTETVSVCALKEPTTPAELQEALESEPTACEEKTVRKITLEGTDGTFVTDADGRFTPEGDPTLLPGDYLLREISAPGEHLILNEWIPFTIPLQDQEEPEAVQVTADNYLTPPPPETPTPTPTPTPTGTETPPESPDDPEMPTTGTNVAIFATLAILLSAAGLALRKASYRS
ncbi:MAG: prealbumin-like fold domain-containing protein, partial [Bowdeniella nasicola]|nr:prealbumin-like fold domain-containing protein [Bowdeniella nasicola]